MEIPLRRTNIVLVIVVIAVLVMTWLMLGTAVAQKATTPKPQDKLALGEDEVKKLLLLIDTDKTGKIEAYENIAQRRMTMELSMAITIVAALAIREIFTALVITLFVLVAEILESLTVGRGRKAIQRLVDLLPSTATVRRHGVWIDLEIAQITLQDVVLVKPGGRIPVDGTVVGGDSFVDQAPITGESMPVEKHPGANLYAGTTNQSGALEVCVERIGGDTTFGKIIAAVETAEKSRAPIQGIADRLAGYLVYFALGAAVLTFLLTHNIRSTISVVIVAGACGIAAGTPLAILGSIGRAAQHGAIIKGGLYLEKLREVDTVLLDKTGTLTYGTPELIDVQPAQGVSDTLLLKTAAIAESRSEHPIGPNDSKIRGKNGECNRRAICTFVHRSARLGENPKRYT
jgi:P-type Cu+ transporter